MLSGHSRSKFQSSVPSLAHESGIWSHSGRSGRPRVSAGKLPPPSYKHPASSSPRSLSGSSTSRAGRHRSPLSQSPSHADPILRAFSGRDSSSHSRRSSAVRPPSERELAMVPYRRGRPASAASSSLHPSDSASGALLARLRARSGSAVSSPLRPSDSVSSASLCPETRDCPADCLQTLGPAAPTAKGPTRGRQPSPRRRSCRWHSSCRWR
jgi:hypothetical protein